MSQCDWVGQVLLHRDDVMKGAKEKNFFFLNIMYFYLLMYNLCPKLVKKKSSSDYQAVSC